jgi:hypothetical protein
MDEKKINKILFQFLTNLMCVIIYDYHPIFLVNNMIE